MALLSSLVSSSDAELVAVVYEEGNLDINDAFASKRLSESWGWWAAAAVVAQASRIFPITPDRIYHTALISSSKHLVEISASNTLLPLLQSTCRPLLFMFGEKNRGRYTSERLLVAAGLQESVRYVPEAGHGECVNPDCCCDDFVGVGLGMHTANPNYVFGSINNLILSAL